MEISGHFWQYRSLDKIYLFRLKNESDVSARVYDLSHQMLAKYHFEIPRSFGKFCAKELLTICQKKYQNYHPIPILLKDLGKQFDVIAEFFLAQRLNETEEEQLTIINLAKSQFLEGKYVEATKNIASLISNGQCMIMNESIQRELSLLLICLYRRSKQMNNSINLSWQLGIAYEQFAPEKSISLYKYILFYCPTRWDVYERLYCLLSDPPAKVHFCLKAALHSIEKGEFRRTELFCKQAEELAYQPFLNCLVWVKYYLSKDPQETSTLVQHLSDWAGRYSSNEQIAEANKVYQYIRKLKIQVTDHQLPLTSLDAQKTQQTSSSRLRSLPQKERRPFLRVAASFPKLETTTTTKDYTTVPQISEISSRSVQLAKNRLNSPLVIPVSSQPETCCENFTSSEANSSFGHSQGEMPPPLAFKQQDIASYKTLLDSGVRADTLNGENLTPLDVALFEGQLEVFSLMLDPTHCIKFSTSSDNKSEFDPLEVLDQEAHYCKLLLDAKQKGSIIGQVFYLAQLSTLYFQLYKNQTHNPLSQYNSLFKASMLINSALGVTEKSKKKYEGLEEALLKRLENFEQLFIHSFSKQVPPKSRYLKMYRQFLKDIRIECENKHEDPFKISLFLTESFKRLINDFLKDAQEILGQPPTDWAAFSMGSMARWEMCPYSDIEFGFLVEQPTLETLDYFRKVSQFLKLRILNMGETEFFCFGENEPSPTPNGFCMDTGGNTPLGVPGWYELICTPEQLAQFQSKQWIDENIILTNTLNCVGYLAGNEKLVCRYELERGDRANEGKEPIHRTLAFRLLNGHLTEFAPSLSAEKEKLKVFGIKKELYRPFQEVLSSLAILYKVKAKSSCSKVEELVNLGVFSKEGGKNLKKGLEQVLKLRLEAHFFYATEGEYLYHIVEGQQRRCDELYLEGEALELLEKIYRILLPFHECASKFYQTGNMEALNKNIFYDDSPSVQGKGFVKALQYSKAHNAYQQAVSLNPKDVNNQLELGFIELTEGKNKDALERNLKSLELALQEFGEDHPTVGTSYSRVGHSYYNLGEYPKALEFHQKSISIARRVFGEHHREIGINYINMGLALNGLGDYKEAMEYYQKGLEISIQVLGKNHPDLASIYQNIGSLYITLGIYKQALLYSKAGLKICSQSKGNNHPTTAQCYNTIGSIYVNLFKFNKSLKFFQKALEIWCQVFDENHPYVAQSYNNIGAAYESLKKNNKALEFYLKALDIRLRVLDKDHPGVAESYHDIGSIYDNLQRFDKALEFYQKATDIQIQTLGKSHSSLADSYNSMGLIFNKLGKGKEALEFYQKALDIFRPALGETHANVASCYINIGTVYYKLEEYDMTFRFFLDAVRILFQTHGKNHPYIDGLTNTLLTCIQKHTPNQRKNIHELHSLFVDIFGNGNWQTKIIAQIVKSIS